MNLIIVALVLVVGMISIFTLQRYKIAGYLMSLGLGLIFGFANSSIADYSLYEAAYQYGPTALGLKFEYGYQILVDFSKKLGLDYLEFRLVIGITGLLLICYFLNKLKINITGCIFLYTFSVFMIDISQVRNFILMVFLIMACVTLIEEKKHSVVKAFIFIIIGSSFQTLGYFFLLIFLIKAIHSVKQLRILFGVMFLMLSIVLAFPIMREYTIALLYQILEFSGYESLKLRLYTENQTKLGFLFYWGIIIFSILACSYNVKVLTYQSSDDADIINRVYELILIAGFSLPLLTFNVEFYRIYRNIFLLVIINFLYALKNIKDLRYKGIVITSLSIILILNFIVVVLPIWNVNVVKVFL